MIRVAIATLGCKTNAFESSVIAGSFGPEEHLIVPFENEADIYVINTCTVTNRTDYKSRNLIRKALARKAADPRVRVVVTGCFAQRSRDEILALGPVDLVVDNQNKQDIASLLDDPGYVFTDIMAAREFSYRPVSRMLDHSRAFMKIQDGCDFYCSYCAVPYGRGHSRSASREDVVAQAKLFVDSGYKEIVLGGVNLGLYRDGSSGLADIVAALAEIEGLELIRLSSLEPQLITDDLLSLVTTCDKLCPHFHLALQSGCDSVLSRMGRHYSTKTFAEVMARIHACRPDLAIGLDVITGFPGESAEEFSATLDFLQSLYFAYLHVFSYSQRKGTPAAGMPGQIPNLEKTRRAQVLIQLGEEKKQAYLHKLISAKTLLRGVCESTDAGLATCLSDHYLRAYTRQTASQGDLLSIVATSLCADGLSDLAQDGGS